MSALTVTQPSQKVSMLAGLLFLLGVVAAITLLMMRLYDWAVDAQKLPVKDIIFGGEFIHLDVNEMKKQIKAQYPQSFIAIDVNEVHKEIEDWPWVYRASVRKQWPNNLSVYVVEQTAVVRWNDDGLLNPYGEVFFVKHPPQHLPRLYGPSGSEKVALQGYQAMQSLLATQDLGVHSLFLSERFAWQLVLSNDVILYLGRHEFIDRVQRFIDLYPLLNKKQRPMAYVDLRYDTGLAVGWRDSDQDKETS